MMWYSWGIVSDVELVPFKRSGMQNHFKFEFEKDPYACFLLLTHFKMVKHENKVHIINPWIFLIFLDILFIKFGVRNKKLFNFQFLLIFLFVLFLLIVFFCLMRQGDVMLTHG